MEKRRFKWFWHFAKGASRGASTKREPWPDWLVKKRPWSGSLALLFYSHLYREIYQSLLCLFEQRRRSSRGNLPVHALRLVQESAVLVQQRAMRLKNNDVVNHQSCQHDHHLELIVYPQEHRAGDQPEDAAVDQILGRQEIFWKVSREEDCFFFVVRKSGGQEWEKVCLDLQEDRSCFCPWKIWTVHSSRAVFRWMNCKQGRAQCLLEKTR